jgi:tRNA dimethylallyltransferase
MEQVHRQRLLAPDSLLIICGPTAIGKTAVAMALQDALGGADRVQLISADSALIYRGMDIGTAKPSPAEQQAYPHKLVDILDPAQSYSAADFVADADEAIVQALRENKKPVVVGGTMMYLKCLLEGIADLPITDPATRAALDQELQDRGADALHEELQQRDPTVAANIHPNNHQRLLRAVAVTRATGQALSDQWQSQATGTLEQRLGINSESLIMMPRDRSVLHQRIEQRFQTMLQQGFLAEVTALMERGDLHRDLPSMRAVGYRQAWSHLLGEIDAAQLVEQGAAATRQLAKRQLTWLRKWSEAAVVVADDPKEAEAFLIGDDHLFA